MDVIDIFFLSIGLISLLKSEVHSRVHCVHIAGTIKWGLIMRRRVVKTHSLYC